MACCLGTINANAALFYLQKVFVEVKKLSSWKILLMSPLWHRFTVFFDRKNTDDQHLGQQCKAMLTCFAVCLNNKSLFYTSWPNHSIFHSDSWVKVLLVNRYSQNLCLLATTVAKFNSACLLRLLISTDEWQLVQKLVLTIQGNVRWFSSWSQMDIFLSASCVRLARVEVQGFYSHSYWYRNSHYKREPLVRTSYV